MDNLSDKLRALECKLAIIQDELNVENPHAIAYFTALETLTELCHSRNEVTRKNAAEILLGLFWNLETPWIPTAEEYAVFKDHTNPNPCTCGPNEGCSSC